MNKDDKVIEELIGQLEHQKDLTQEYKDACNKHMTKIMELTVEIERLLKEQCPHDYGLAKAALMREDGLIKERDALRERVRELEDRNAELLDDVYSCAECGGFHEIQKRDYRDRLDRMVASWMNTCTNARWLHSDIAAGVEDAAQCLAAIDAHLEGKG